MPIDPAAVLTLAASCAPTVAPATLLAIAQVESGLDPLAIGVNGPAPGERPASQAEAVRRAHVLIAQGRDIDLGLAQINVRNLARLGLTVPDAFDACRNLQASARVLTAGYHRAAGGPVQARLRTALSYYNTGHPTRGFDNGYVAKVERAAGAPRQASPASAVVVSLAVPAPDWNVFARPHAWRADLVLSPNLGAQP